jgi:hypothetical protein
MVRTSAITMNLSMSPEEEQTVRGDRKAKFQAKLFHMKLFM